MDELPLPDPLDYCYEWDGPYGSRKFSAASYNGRPPDRSVAIYTADHIRKRDAIWQTRLNAAVAMEREKNAKALDDKAHQIAAKAEQARIDEPDEVSGLLSTAWQFQVAAAAIRGA